MNVPIAVETERVYYRFEDVEDGHSTEAELHFVTPFEGVPSLETYNKKVGDQSRFWRRQFGATETRRQRKCDWVFGVFLPLICFYFDPIVFSERAAFSFDNDPGLLSAYRTIAYPFCFVSIMTLAAFLLWGDRLKWLNAAIAGVLFSSALAAFAIGVILIPFSLIGLIFIIGVLGFTPLFTGIIYVRNAVRATRMGSPYFDRSTLFYIASLSALAGLIIPYIFGR